MKLIVTNYRKEIIEVITKAFGICVTVISGIGLILLIFGTSSFVYSQSIKGVVTGQKEYSYIIANGVAQFCGGNRFLILADKGIITVICEQPDQIVITLQGSNEQWTVGNTFKFDRDALKIIAENWDKINK